MSDELRDNEDAETISEIQWSAAIAEWIEHDPARLFALILDGGEIPAFAREFLAALARGEKLRGKGGRPAERDGWVERAIAAEVFSEWDRLEAQASSARGSPQDEAYALVAARRGITAGAIRGVVQKLQDLGIPRGQGLGITRDNWRKWGRPHWRNK